MPMVSAELVPPPPMPPVAPLLSEAVCPGANPFQRSLVADSWEVDGAVLFRDAAVWPLWGVALLCVGVADEVDVEVPAVGVTGAVATGVEATGVAGTTELGVVGAGVGLAAGVE